jgi:hypothetical protein
MRKLLSALAVALAVACAIDGAAQQPEKGYWRAASHTAASVTGDITISGSKITINFKNFLISPVRSLKPEEVSAAFDEALDTARQGWLYRLNIPASQRISSRNTLCGNEETDWMATYVAGNTLKVVFFTGDNAPVMTFEALQNSTSVCGSYTYVR